MIRADLKNFIEKMPKIELHVHLEGSVRPDTLLLLAEKNRIKLPASNLRELKDWYQFTDFDKFIEVYLKISECIRSTEDLELITMEFLKDQKRQNIIYTEVTYTPYTHYTQKGLPFSDQLSAFEKARKRGLNELGIDCRFIMDINREVEPEKGEITAGWLMEHQDSSIAALGLGGQEAAFPPKRHKGAFDIIRGSRYHSVPHAGEVAGPDSVYGALDLLKAERLGHGVRAFEDPDLVKRLVKEKITLEVCPSSNICLKVFPSMKEHILPKLAEAGLMVTINSDDPPMFNTSLTDEYLRIHEAFGFSERDFWRFNQTAIEAAFIEKAEKEKLKQKYFCLWEKAGGRRQYS